MTTISIDPDSTYTDGGTGNTLNLGNNDTITASGDTITIAAGDDETITGSNDILNTGAYAGDTIVLGANTSVTDTGSGNTFDMGTGDSVSAVGTFIVGANAVDTITAPANIWENSLVLNGGGATVSTILDGDQNTGTRWDIINQSAGQVSDTVNLGLGSSAHFNNTFILTVSGDGQNGALTILNCDLGNEIVAEITVESDTNSQINMIDGDAYELSIRGGSPV